MSNHFEQDTTYEVFEGSDWKQIILSQPNEAQLLAEDTEYEQIINEGIYDPSLQYKEKWCDKDYAKTSTQDFLVMHSSDKRWYEYSDDEPLPDIPWKTDIKTSTQDSRNTDYSSWTTVKYKNKKRNK